MPKFWTDIKQAQLRDLWEADELSAAEIGRELGCTGNAVVGKANRLGLRARRPEGVWGRRKRGDPSAGSDSLARYGSSTRHLSPWADEAPGVVVRVLTA